MARGRADQAGTLPQPDAAARPPPAWRTRGWPAVGLPARVRRLAGHPRRARRGGGRGPAGGRAAPRGGRRHRAGPARARRLLRLAGCAGPLGACEPGPGRARRRTRRRPGAAGSRRCLGARSRRAGGGVRVGAGDLGGGGAGGVGAPRGAAAAPRPVRPGDGVDGLGRAAGAGGAAQRGGRGRAGGRGEPCPGRAPRPCGGDRPPHRGHPGGGMARRPQGRAHVARDQGEWQVGGGAPLPLPLFDRRRGALAADEAELDALLERHEGRAVGIQSSAREARTGSSPPTSAPAITPRSSCRRGAGWWSSPCVS